MFWQLVETYKLKLSGNRTDDHKGIIGYSMSQLKFWKQKFSNRTWDEWLSPRTIWFDAEGKKATTWMPLGRLPRWSRQSNIEAYKHSKKVNRYLEYQETRIIKAVDKKQYKKATIIWLILLKNSFSYQICLFNKVMPQWHYLLNRIEAKNLVRKIVNKCRSADMELTLRRFYILKADGVRWRPIGAPDYPSRVISRSLNDLIYVLWEDKFNNNQHGFRRNRGAATAIFNIISKLKNNPTIVYEFDLKSYFNTVRPMWVYRVLCMRSQLLAEYVYKLIMKINYKLPNDRVRIVKVEFSDKYVWMVILNPLFLLIAWKLINVFGIIMWGLYLMCILEIGFDAKNATDREIKFKKFSMLKTRYDSIESITSGSFNVIKPERELRTKTIGIGTKGEKLIHTEPMNIKFKDGYHEIEVPYITREGLPQGLSISPVLATLTMELFKNPKELVLYADDGVFIGNDWSKFKKWRQDVSLVGAEIADEKSGMVGNSFKFLGTLIDRKGECIIYKNKKISWWDPELMHKLKILYSEEPYKKNKKGWNWDVRPNSVTAMNYTDYMDLVNFPIVDYILIWYKSLVWGLPHKGYRMFKNNCCIDILSASSFAMNEMVKSKAELNLVALKPLCPVFKGKLSNFCMNKSSYYEEIYENSLRNYIRKELPEYNNVMENYWDQ